MCAKDAGNHNVLDYLGSVGLPTFPIPRNKKTPTQKQFFDIATTDPDFSLSLNNAGVATGGGIVVLDFDVKPHLGIDTLPILAAWDAMGLPESLRVRTPSGGVHVYLRTPPGRDVANSASKLARGVDVRGHHGYTVAPGSSIPAGRYEMLTHPPELGTIPPWLLDRCTAPRERDSDGAPLIELDLPENVVGAAHYLVTSAPEAIEGNSGDATTFATICRVRDFGLSEDMALEVMAEHWNETKASPPWDLDDLTAKVANAYAYAQRAPGSKAPQAEFAEHLTPEQLAAIEATRLAHQRPSYEPQPDTRPIAELALQPLTPFEPERDLEPRRPILGHFLYRKNVTTLIAPPGVGKTTLGISAALAIASGRQVLGAHFAPKIEPAHVFYWNQEDDLNEIKLRLSAAMRYHQITWDDITDPVTNTSRLHFHSGVDRALHMAVHSSDGHSLVGSEDAKRVLEYITRHKIAAAIFDPLVELHPGEENDNVAMGQVARVFRRIANIADCGVAIVHHTRKPAGASAESSAGDMNSGRGAGSIMGVARVAATLYSLDDKTAKRYGVAEEDRHRYVRYDDAKANLALLSGEPVIFERVGVPFLEWGDEVGLLVAADLSTVERVEVPANVFAADVRWCLDDMFARGVRSAGWAQVAETLAADGYEGAADGEDAAGRYALIGTDALRKRVRRLFDEDSGAPVSPELDGYAITGKGRATKITRGEHVS